MHTLRVKSKEIPSNWRVLDEIPVRPVLLEEFNENPDFKLAYDSLDPITLNHRVPGSSPGAPTNPFKNLAGFTV